MAQLVVVAETERTYAAQRAAQARVRASARPADVQVFRGGSRQA